MNTYNYFIALLISILIVISCNKTSPNKQNTDQWLISSYNFGEMGKMSIPNQITLLRDSGYHGIILKSETKKDFEIFDQYLMVTDSLDDFKIDAVFERYRHRDDDERRERWKEVVDKIAGKSTQLWMIFSKGFDDVFMEEKIREIVSYATSKKVVVVLYPHSGTYLESAEEALVFADKINHPNLKVAFHLYHEIRAGHGSRIPEVIKNIKHRLGAVTLAGTDSIPDNTSALTRDTTTIKPFGRGNYNIKDFIDVLSNAGYKGSVGFMNFKFKTPKEYLPRSKKIWDDFLKE